MSELQNVQPMLEEAKRAVDNWPDWIKRATTRVPITAPGVRSTVHLIEGRIYRDIPHWYREEQERGES